eukprot:gene4595-5876_t
MKTVPLHQVHVELGAKIVPFAGFEMPVRYSSDMEEHHTVRNNVGKMADIEDVIISATGYTGA